jgi:hypothetical protein
MLAVTIRLSIGTPFIIIRIATNLTGIIQVETSVIGFHVAQVLLIMDIWPQILFVCCKQMELLWMIATMPRFGMYINHNTICGMCPGQTLSILEECLVLAISHLQLFFRTDPSGQI